MVKLFRLFDTGCRFGIWTSDRHPAHPLTNPSISNRRQTFLISLSLSLSLLLECSAKKTAFKRIASNWIDFRAYFRLFTFRILEFEISASSKHPAKQFNLELFVRFRTNNLSRFRTSFQLAKTQTFENLSLLVLGLFSFFEVWVNSLLKSVRSICCVSGSQARSHVEQKGYRLWKINEFLLFRTASNRNQFDLVALLASSEAEWYSGAWIIAAGRFNEESLH